MNKTCIVQNGEVIPCQTLDKAVDDLYTRVRKGIFELLVTNLIRDEWKVKGYGVKTGEYKKQGIVFNYCPFCGVDIGSHLKTKAKEVLGDESRDQV